ncbi:nuclear transcription factor Y subunit beta-like [Daphnia carinata]|uniref:nuclear transcription factor Y subunit beta-like n=1 Tax=Daphnia carinata TaxID=120202 RepID=UPI002868B2D6|nr:nuclear transcription factor Y subunit beta-like [Daphnia carinata]
MSAQWRTKLGRLLGVQLEQREPPGQVEHPEHLKQPPSSSSCDFASSSQFQKQLQKEQGPQQPKLQREAPLHPHQRLQQPLQQQEGVQSPHQHLPQRPLRQRPEQLQQPLRQQELQLLRLEAHLLHQQTKRLQRPLQQGLQQPHRELPQLRLDMERLEQPRQQELPRLSEPQWIQDSFVPAQVETAGHSGFAEQVWHGKV